VLLIASVLIAIWLNANYFLGAGYKVFILLIFPVAIIFKKTVDSFQNLSFTGGVFFAILIGFIWIAVAGISVYYLLLNSFGG
jgi:hypothetical protein